MKVPCKRIVKMRSSELYHELANKLYFVPGQRLIFRFLQMLNISMRHEDLEIHPLEKLLSDLDGSRILYMCEECLKSQILNAIYTGRNNSKYIKKWFEIYNHANSLPVLFQKEDLDTIQTLYPSGINLQCMKKYINNHYKNYGRHYPSEKYYEI